MRISVSFILAMLLGTLILASCKSGNSGYDKSADAMKELDAAIAKAQQRDCNILVQIGGEWCHWCIMLNRFIEGDKELKKLLTTDYVWLHVYYGKDNKNEEALKRLGTPTGVGFPVFVILSPEGTVIHTQPTGELEEGESYSRDKISSFLKKWANVREAETPVDPPADEAVGTDEEPDNSKLEDVASEAETA